MSISKPSYTINANDPRLAHGTSKWLCDVQPTLKMVKAVSSLQGTTRITAKKITDTIPKQLHKYLLTSYIRKPHGSRANAMWLLLAPMQDFFSLSEIHLHCGVCAFNECGVRLTHHCFARLMQRTSNTSDVAQTVAFLKTHLLGVLYQLHRSGQGYGRVDQGTNVVAYTRHGKLILQEQHGMLWGKTWVDIESYHAQDRERAAQLDIKGDVYMYWGEE